jgi:hypothetical protein
MGVAMTLVIRVRVAVIRWRVVRIRKRVVRIASVGVSVVG